MGDHLLCDWLTAGTADWEEPNRQEGREALEVVRVKS
jgi:hypothetical protein